MKTMKKKCPVCEKMFIYTDLRHIPKTCGMKMCEINQKYREKTRNLQTGEYTSWDKVNKL